MKELLRRPYNTIIRNNIPKRLVSLEGVAVRSLPWFDTIHEQSYESALCKGIDEAVTPRDNVLLLGAGKGVSSIYAAVMAGKGGEVTVVDVSKNSIKNT